MTVCNYWNYFWTYIAEHFSEPDYDRLGASARCSTSPAPQDDGLGTMGADEPGQRQERRPGDAAVRRRTSRTAPRSTPTAAPTARPASAATSSARRGVFPKQYQDRRATRARPASRARRSPAARRCPKGETFTRRARDRARTRTCRAVGAPMRLHALQHSAIGLVALVVVVRRDRTSASPRRSRSSRHYEIKAAFQTPTTSGPDSPVRIAGVEVGKVTGVERANAGGSGAIVTMRIDDKGLPIHKRRDRQDPAADLPRGQLLRRPHAGLAVGARDRATAARSRSSRPRRRSSSTRSSPRCSPTRART